MGMQVLFVVSHTRKTRTVFRLAERISDNGLRIVFLFTRDACRLAADPELVKSLHFAAGLYVLKGDGRSTGFLGDLAEGVEAMDFAGWVGLLEACDRVVSWT